MDAVLIQTDGMFCDFCPPHIRSEVEHLPGVKAAVAYRSMHLTSVLFDPDVVDVKVIVDRIERAGFDAHVLDGGHTH